MRQEEDASTPLLQYRTSVDLRSIKQYWRKFDYEMASKSNIEVHWFALRHESWGGSPALQKIYCNHRSDHIERQSSIGPLERWSILWADVVFSVGRCILAPLRLRTWHALMTPFSDGIVPMVARIMSTMLVPAGRTFRLYKNGYYSCLCIAAC